MRFQLQYRTYRRKFKHPVRFGDICVNVREGIIVKLVDDQGVVGFGEVAPLESFGSESVEKAAQMLKSFCGLITRSQISNIQRREYPCLSYALSNACYEIVTRSTASRDEISFVKLVQNSQLGEDKLLHASIPETACIKIKIGGDVFSTKEEIESIRRIDEQCRLRGISIRLDANERLTVESCKRWFDFLTDNATNVEFIEQPLDRMLIQEMIDLKQHFRVNVALDESVAILLGNLSPGIETEQFLYVLKPSLGDLDLISHLKIPHEHIVLSSVFETAIGFSSLLNLPYMKRIPGFDTQTIFEDKLSYPLNGMRYINHSIDKEAIWNQLS